MYSQTTTATTMSSSSPHSDSRLTVADILSSMANGEVITPSTLANFEGFSTGVLTQTTPTLTPTTLRNIEQTFIELQTVPPQQTQHQNQAGFVTPIVNPLHSTSNSITILSSAPSSVSPPPSTYHTLSIRSTTSSGSSTASDTGSSPPWSGGSPGIVTTKSTGRNMGGRRPAKHEKLTPEEEERRRIRRERNKLAAARCRKRRLDHTNCLVNETDGLEEKRLTLQTEIQDLQTQKEELEFILEAHKVVCKLQKHGHCHGGRGSPSNHHDPADVKPILSELNLTIVSTCNHTPPTISLCSPMSHTTGTVSTAGKRSQTIPPAYSLPAKPSQRPNTLNLVTSFVAPQPPSTVPSSNPITTHANGYSKMTITEATGIVISTPSSGIFNFEALMAGGTGLTPVSSGMGLTPVSSGMGLTPIIPTCSTQQRSSSSDLSSPDTISPPKLVSL